MGNIEFSNKLKSEFDKFNIEYTDKKVEKLNLYKNILLEWNNKINLTTITKESDIIKKHFIDSLSILNLVNKKDKIIDVGTGAGFPGIPLSIFLNADITLLDSLNKRIIYLNDVIEKLNLQNIEAIHGRSEEIGQEKKYREQYDVAVSRAVAPMNVLVEYLLPFVKIGGRCICMKGPNVIEELESAKNAIKILGGEIEKIIKFNLDEEEGKRNLVVIKKVKETLSKYPRKAGVPRKMPL